MKSILTSKVIFLSFFFCSFFAHGKDPDSSIKPNPDLAAENAALKKEIQELRKLLASKASVDKPSKETEPTENDSEESDKSTKKESGNSEFWLSKSGKRHNPDCRYFKKSEGKSCTEDEGTACGVCGG